MRCLVMTLKDVFPWQLKLNKFLFVILVWAPRSAIKHLVMVMVSMVAVRGMHIQRALW